MIKYVIFTDLDGTLLDSVDYTFHAANEAIHALRERNVPLILVSSKTRAEMEPIRFRLDNLHPFISENGGGLHIPKGLFAFPLEGAALRGPYQVVEWGTPYVVLRAALKELEHGVGCPLRGFGDMSPEEIAERTGLTGQEAHLAKQRDYDEPFILEGRGEIMKEVRRHAEARGLQVIPGGRFSHLTGGNDKGQACRRLLTYYRPREADPAGRVVTIGIGDSLNDIPMLDCVDHPVLVQKPDRSYEAGVRPANLIRAPGIGPVGWNRAVLDLLRNIETMVSTRSGTPPTN